MSFIAKPKIANLNLPRNELGLTRRDYDGAMSTLCAGCGHDSITAAIIEAVWSLSISPEQLVKLSGIGCSSKSTAYFVSGAPASTAYMDACPQSPVAQVLQTGSCTISACRAMAIPCPSASGNWLMPSGAMSTWPTSVRTMVCMD